MSEEISARRRVKTHVVYLVLRAAIVGALLFQTAFGADDPLTYVPKNAIKLLPTVRTQQNLIFPENPVPGYLGALFEQESCVSLTSSKCWQSDSKLDTSRELGVGICQITKAFNKSGGIRFDTLKDLKKKYPEELEDLTWDNIDVNGDLQVRACLLLFKDNYDDLDDVPSAFNRVAMADSAFNAGIGSVKKARTVCGMTKGCNPDIWFGNVELSLPMSSVALYGQRSALDINREHVRNDMSLRLWKYRPYLY